MRVPALEADWQPSGAGALQWMNTYRLHNNANTTNMLTATAARSRLDAFLAGLQSLGWIDGRNVHIDIRWGAGDVNKVQVLCGRACVA